MGFIKTLRRNKKCEELSERCWISRGSVGIAKAAAVKLNTGSYPPILPASGNELGLWKKR